MDAEEVLCVLDYDDYSFINSCELEIPQNGGEHLVVKTIYSEDSDETETRQMLLDQDYHVISEPLRKNAISNEQIQHSNRKLLRGCGASAAYDAGWSNSHNTEGSGLGLAITPPKKKRKSSKPMAVPSRFWTSRVRASARNLRFCFRR